MCSCVDSHESVCVLRLYFSLSLSLSTYVSVCVIVFICIFLAIWNYDGDASYHLSLCVGDLIVIIEKLQGLFTFSSSFLFFLLYCFYITPFLLSPSPLSLSLSLPFFLLGWYRGYLYHYPSKKVCHSLCVYQLKYTCINVFMFLGVYVLSYN